MIKVTQELIDKFREGWDADEDDQRIRNGLEKVLNDSPVGKVIEAAKKWRDLDFDEAEVEEDMMIALNELQEHQHD